MKTAQRTIANHSSATPSSTPSSTPSQPQMTSTEYRVLSGIASNIATRDKLRGEDRRQNYLRLKAEYLDTRNDDPDNTPALFSQWLDELNEAKENKQAAESKQPIMAVNLPVSKKKSVASSIIQKVATLEKPSLDAIQLRLVELYEELDRLIALSKK